MGTREVVTGKTRLEMTVVPHPQSVSLARVFVKHQLISLRYADLVENANQIATELVSNAINSGAQSIRLYLGPNGGRPLLEVWDSSPQMPVLRVPDFVSESGRGLHIVKTLAADFGWREDRERGGKSVWARLV